MNNSRKKNIHKISRHQKPKQQKNIKFNSIKKFKELFVQHFIISLHIKFQFQLFLTKDRIYYGNEVTTMFEKHTHTHNNIISS